MSKARAGHDVVRASTGNDVWAWGVLLWEITSGGQRPYRDVTLGPGGVQTHVKQGGRLMVPDGAPTVLREAMGAAWTTDPTERPSMKDMHDLVCRSPLEASDRVVEVLGGVGDGEAEGKVVESSSTIVPAEGAEAAVRL